MADINATTLEKFQADVDQWRDDYRHFSLQCREQHIKPSVDNFRLLELPKSLQHINWLVYYEGDKYRKHMLYPYTIEKLGHLMGIDLPPRELFDTKTVDQIDEVFFGRWRKEIHTAMLRYPEHLSVRKNLRLFRDRIGRLFRIIMIHTIKWKQIVNRFG